MSSPVRGGGASPQVDSVSPGLLNQEMGVVLTGLNDFKDELLHLHSVVSNLPLYSVTPMKYACDEFGG